MKNWAPVGVTPMVKQFHDHLERISAFPRWCRVKCDDYQKYTYRSHQLELLGKGRERSFPGCPAARTATVESPGIGSWRTGKRVSLSQTEWLRIRG